MPRDPLRDNPDRLDTRAEVADEIRRRGHDPMDIRRNDQLTFGWSLLHSGGPGSRLGGRAEETVALEAERIISAAGERDVELREPLDLALERIPDHFEDDDLIV